MAAVRPRQSRAIFVLTHVKRPRESRHAACNRSRPETSRSALRLAARGYGERGAGDIRLWISPRSEQRGPRVPFHTESTHSHQWLAVFSSSCLLPGAPVPLDTGLAVGIALRPGNRASAPANTRRSTTRWPGPRVTRTVSRLIKVLLPFAQSRPAPGAPDLRPEKAGRKALPQSSEFL